MMKRIPWEIRGSQFLQDILIAEEYRGFKKVVGELSMGKCYYTWGVRT
jgi:hypothetical protein